MALEKRAACFGDDEFSNQDFGEQCRLLKESIETKEDETNGITVQLIKQALIEKEPRLNLEVLIFGNKASEAILGIFGISIRPKPKAFNEREQMNVINA